MGRVRKATQKEEEIYPILEQITGGRERNFGTARAEAGYNMFIRRTGAFGYAINWFKGYSSYGGIYEFSRLPAEIKAKYAEELKAIDEFMNMYHDGERLIGQADRMRLDLIEKMKKDYCWDAEANFANGYEKLTDQDEARWKELKENPEMVQEMINKARDLQAKIEALPPKGTRTQKQAFQNELNSLKTDLALIKEYL